MLRDEEKEELGKAAYSSQLRKDLKRMVQKRHNPFIVNGNIDLD